MIATEKCLGENNQGVHSGEWGRETVRADKRSQYWHSVPCILNQQNIIVKIMLLPFTTNTFCSWPLPTCPNVSGPHRRANTAYAFNCLGSPAWALSLELQGCSAGLDRVTQRETIYLHPMSHDYVCYRTAVASPDHLKEFLCYVCIGQNTAVFLRKIVAIISSSLRISFCEFKKDWVLAQFFSLHN